MEPDENGVRVATLDEMLYRKLLWNHRPITDFWRVGRGYRKKLEKNEDSVQYIQTHVGVGYRMMKVE